MTDTAPADLLAAANVAMQRAYAPYSNFKVGVALRDKSGNIHSGCNVENASYSVVQCAEANAVGGMLAAGGTEITELVVLTASSDSAAPCGACRQIINEFASTDGLAVYLCSTNGTCRQVDFADLLPYAFGPEQLDSK